MAKVKFTFDGKELEAEEGTYVMDAARDAGLMVPSMCYERGHAPQNSCLTCVIKVNGNPNLVPSCSRPVEEGMVVESDTEEVGEVRKTALELILSDHVGDCYAPCAAICPAHMEIPQMLRQVTDGDYKAAVKTIKRDIPFPSVLGRICPEHCEGGCRRGRYDTSESICGIERFVGDQDMQSEQRYMPEQKPQNGKRIAVVGAGTTGMTNAYFMKVEGYDVTLYEKQALAGGELRTEFKEDELPRNIIDSEVSLLTDMGINIEYNSALGEQLSIPELVSEFDAVFISIGVYSIEEYTSMGLEAKGKKVDVQKTSQTKNPKLFLGGRMVHGKDKKVYSIAAGKAAAISMHQFLSGKPVVGRDKRFNSISPRLSKDNIDTMMERVVNKKDRYSPNAIPGTAFSEVEMPGFEPEVAQKESSRCLHCDCRAKDKCDLRDFSEHFDASQKHYAGVRRPISKLNEGSQLHLDSGKCLQCGLCVQVAQDGGEDIGLAYEGRGFNTAIVVPFGQSLTDALSKTAKDCVRVCPTGAIEFKPEPASVNNPFDVVDVDLIKR